jgi:hypothetical protein
MRVIFASLVFEGQIRIKARRQKGKEARREEAIKRLKPKMVF